MDDEKILGVYFRFLSAQYATMPMTATTTTAAMMAISVVIKGASAGCSGSVGSGSVGSDSVGSGSVGSGSVGSVGSVGSAGSGSSGIAPEATMSIV